jgi:hypothetical protein
MSQTQIPFVTSETDLAVYLILSGINLLEIQYEPRSTSNGRKRGIFVFQANDKIPDFKNLYESGQASINMADWKKTKSDLLDRLMKELP